MYELQASPFPPCSITSLLISVRIGKVPHAVEHWKFSTNSYHGNTGTQRLTSINGKKCTVIITPNILDAISVWCSIQTKWCHYVKFLWYQVWQECLLTPLLLNVNSVLWMPPSFDPTHLSIHTQPSDPSLSWLCSLLIM